MNGAENDASTPSGITDVTNAVTDSMNEALRSAGVGNDSTNLASKPIEFSVTVLERLIEEFSIRDREAFIEFAASLRQDENNYLKENELIVAAKQWVKDLNQMDVETVEEPYNEEANEIESLLQLGEECSRKNDPKGALTAFNKAIALDPSCDMAWFNRGVLLEAEQDARGARQAFQICLDINPEHAPATANLSILLERIGDESAAYSMAIRALSFFPGHPTLLEVKQRCAESGNEVTIETMPVEEPTQSYEEKHVMQVMEEVGVDDAEAILSEARHHDNDENQHLEYQELKAAAEVVAATQEIQTVIDQNEVVEEIPQPILPPKPDKEEHIDLETLVEQATNLIRNGDAQKALEILSPHLKTIGANHAGAWRIAGGAMARLELDDHAISALEHAQSIDPSQGSGWFNLGSIYQRKENYSRAVECYVLAMNAQPNYLKAALKCSTLCSEIGDIENYLHATRVVLQLEPTNNVRNSFIEVLIHLAEGEANVLNSVQGLPPTLPEGPHLAKEALRYLGNGETRLHARAYTAAKDDVQAVTAWKSMIKSNPEHAENWRGLAKTLESAGDLETAQKCHAKAQSLESPNNSNETNMVDQQPIPSPIPEPVSVPEIPQPQISPQEQQADYYMNALGLQTPTEATPDVIQPETTSLINHNLEPEQSSQILFEPVQAAPAMEQSIVENQVNLTQVAIEAQEATENIGTKEVNSMSVSNQDIAWYNQGVGLIEDGKYSEALSCFDRALPSFAGNDEMLIRILNGRGNAYYFLEDYPKCVESYHQAMLIRPAEVEGKTLYNMGSAYAEMERYGDAIKCFEQSIPRDLSPEQVKRAKEQIRRCGILLKDAERKMKRR